ncbi:DUF6432 family protein [Halapricum desulfuricans]|uniref:Transcriptional regulator, contains HTH domain n=1 Tax=Halapricum desulfuricans TaxID=2841257 RepID=A0A897N6T1_9EURY|nr:DUF6432 family protein [Halapricum desulfuricans]QSG06795.1 Transcriptional regulator, contains HTH domain [Halapricum desulfuricans]QSG09745.1 Transcriptional regulator, contains HTH domain [Halapricum desulfuricans]QSG11160.1 Transcriptional regulator, contains HTH domain [Halapricum desulfuricans]
MQAKPEYRDRDDDEVAVLDALADRADEGMTVFELRSHVDLDIDDLEDALAELKADGLISADDGDERTVVVPDENVIGPDQHEENSTLSWLRDRLPF